MARNSVKFIQATGTPSAATYLRGDGSWSTPAGGGSVTRGTATIDFGVFPGKSDTSFAVTGQTAVTVSTIVKAWIYPQSTADHSADEHLVETLDVFAGNVVAGTGFTIYGINESQINQPNGTGTRIYGLWTVAWEY